MMATSSSSNIIKSPFLLWFGRHHSHLYLVHFSSLYLLHLRIFVLPYSAVLRLFQCFERDEKSLSSAAYSHLLCWIQYHWLCQFWKSLYLLIYPISNSHSISFFPSSSKLFYIPVLLSVSFTFTITITFLFTFLSPSLSLILKREKLRRWCLEIEHCQLRCCRSFWGWYEG